MSLIHTTIEHLFDEIAEAIRVQEGSSALIVADNFPKRIRGLATLDTSDATATSSTILSGYTAYANGTKITGNYTPLDTSDASANATMIQSGETAYVNGVKITGTLPVTSSFSFPLTSYGPAAVSETPAAIVLSLNNPTKTIVEANSPIALQAALPSFGGVSAADVIAGQTFTSTAGLKKTGTFTIDAEISDQQDLISQIQAALEGKSGQTSTYVGTGLNLYTGDQQGNGYYPSENSEGDLLSYNAAVPTGFIYAAGGRETFNNGSTTIQVTNSCILDLNDTPVSDKGFFIIPNTILTIDSTNSWYITVWGYRNLEGWYVGSQAYCPNADAHVSTYCDASGNFTALTDGGTRYSGTYTNVNGGNGFTSVLNQNWITLNPFCIPFTSGGSSYSNNHMSQVNNYNGIAGAPDLIAIKLTE